MKKEKLIDIVKSSANAETHHLDIKVFAEESSHIFEKHRWLIESWSHRAVNM
jgi:hypothetical protein